MSELKPLPCPFCGDAPRSVERPDNIDGTRFFYAVACYCGGYSARAHQMAVEATPEQAKHTAIEAWNRRAQSSTQTPVEVGTTVQAGQMLTDDEIALVVADCSASAHRQDDFSFARAIEQAVLAKRVPQWRDIETAPKDWGVTKFDVWANDVRFADCWWGKATYEQGEPGIVYQSDYDCNGPVDSYVRNATHWMHLPPPPGNGGEKGQP